MRVQAEFTVAGAADCVRFAEAERLADMLAALLPACTVTKVMKHPDEWPAYAEQLQQTFG